MRLLPDGRTAPDANDDAVTGRDEACSDGQANIATNEHDCVDCRFQLAANVDTHSAHKILDFRLQAAIAQMSQGFAMFDEAHCLVACNDAFRDLYVLPAELTQPGSTFWDILAHGAKMGLRPKSSALSREDLREIIKNRKPWSAIDQVHNGRIISTIHEPLHDGGWISLLDDVTGQRQREQAEMDRLREAEVQTMRFNAAINNMSQGLSMFDSDHRLVAYNDTFVRLYRLTPELARPGTGFIDILRHREEAGFIEKGETADKVMAQVDAAVASHSAVKAVITMTNGRIVIVSHQPLADGGWLSTHEDITDQHRNAELVHFMARHDNLTGLANRTTFLETVADAERGIATGDIMAVFAIDLERFKDVNDAFGHMAGDAVLCEIGERLRTELEGRGLPARLGGDDFAALVGPLQSADEARDLASSLIASLRQPIVINDLTVFCNAAIGIALAPAHGRETNELMHNADIALGAAKADPQKTYAVFEPVMDRVLRRRQSIERGLRTAITDNSLSLHFQPLVALETGHVSCCEALLRWQSPELGPVAPTEFIPIAEETGLIRDIGVWALEAACVEATNWPCDVRVAVNVSVVQFQGDDLVDQVAHALTISGLDPSRLELEITESLFMADDEHNLEVLHRLRDLGVRFALDDFGSGYSSLAYLLRFPFHKVKIDRSIVSTIAEKPEVVTLVTAIIDLCKGFGMETVAEGIETEDQLAQIEAHGCDLVQGYIFSPPLPRSAIGTLLSRRRLRVDIDRAEPATRSA